MRGLLLNLQRGGIRHQVVLHLVQQLSRTICRTEYLLTGLLVVVVLRTPFRPVV